MQLLKEKEYETKEINSCGINSYINNRFFIYRNYSKGTRLIQIRLQLMQRIHRQLILGLKSAQATTGDYIADSYEGVESGYVFESVTQERLLDILSSKGNYYIVFAGPEHKTSKATIAKINEIAKKDGITKIYHFDPYVDGYQLDITDEDTKFKGSRGTSINDYGRELQS